MESMFIKTLGDYPLIRVLDFLLENRVFDYSKSEIARQSGITRNTLDTLWKHLLGQGILKKTRVIGRATMYRLDSESPIVKRLVDFDFAISKAYAEKEVLGQAHKHPEPIAAR